jgi:hypothetical protein
VQLLQVAAEIFTEGHRQPVEQFRMTRFGAHAAEVVRGFDEASTEVMLPHAVHDAAPGERVVFVRDPLRQSGAAVGFIVTPNSEGNMKSSSLNAAMLPGPTSLRRLFDVAALEHLNDARLAAVACL